MKIICIWVLKNSYWTLKRGSDIANCLNRVQIHVRRSQTHPQPIGMVSGALRSPKIPTTGSGQISRQEIFNFGPKQRLSSSKSCISVHHDRNDVKI